MSSSAEYAAIALEEVGIDIIRAHFRKLCEEFGVVNRVIAEKFAEPECVYRIEVRWGDGRKSVFWQPYGPNSLHTPLSLI